VTVTDLPLADYHAHRALSASGARLLLPPNTPALYRWRMDHPEYQERTATFDLGHTAHTMALGKGAPIIRIDAPDWRTNAARAMRDDAYAAGETPILADDYDRVVEMAAALRKHPLADALLSRGKPEQTLMWTDKTTGVPCRARVDWLPDPGRGRLIIPDFKTARSADPTSFAKSAASYGYALQAAWYIQGAVTLGLHPDPAFVFVVQEKTPPYLVSTVELDVEALRMGREKARKAREIFARCTESGEWPGYPQDVVLVSLPTWASYAHDEEMAAAS
jgi:PDDEXK-like domain of unknown function (DUF3799)